MSHCLATQALASQHAVFLGQCHSLYTGGGSAGSPRTEEFIGQCKLLAGAKCGGVWVFFCFVKPDILSGPSLNFIEQWLAAKCDLVGIELNGCPGRYKGVPLHASYICKGEFLGFCLIPE